MSSRFPTPSGDDSLHDLIASGLLALHHGEPPFEWKEESGQLIGCYTSMPYVFSPVSEARANYTRYTPHITPHAFELQKSVYSPETLPARTRQMGVLATAATFDAPYIVYCHRPTSAKLGFSDEQFQDAISGRTPKGIPEEEVVAYETALLLARDRKALSDEAFERAEKILGRPGVAGLANVVAAYLYVCILVSVAGPHPGGFGEKTV